MQRQNKCIQNFRNDYKFFSLKTSSSSDGLGSQKKEFALQALFVVPFHQILFNLLK